MCIKIVHTHDEFEFEPGKLLEQQVKGAKQIIIDYKPNDTRIEAFMDQMGRIVRTGVSCQMNIQVKSNNTLSGYRLGRQIDKAINNLELNEVVKSLVNSYSETDRKLQEIQEFCMKGVT